MKRMASVVLTLMMLASLTGCADAVPQSEYDAVCAERDELRAELDAIHAERESACADTMRVSISGSFTATVRSIIPDYCFDDTTPSVAVVTLFQSLPFIVRGSELAGQLEVGKTYVFEIRTVENIEIARSEYDHTPLDPMVVVPTYNLWIESVRLAGEGEWVLESSHLVFEAADRP